VIERPPWKQLACRVREEATATAGRAPEITFELADSPGCPKNVARAESVIEGRRPGGRPIADPLTPFWSSGK